MIRAVFMKETLDALRDRRSLAAALVMGPLLGPVMFAVGITAAVDQQEEQVEARISLPVEGAERAPNLLAFLKSQNVKVEKAPADPVAAVRSGEKDFVLVIGEEFGAQLAAAEPAEVTVISDDSRRSSEVAVGRIEDLLRGYGDQIGDLRLRLHGVDPLITRAVFVDAVDLSTPESRGAAVLVIYVFFLVFSIFIGNLYVAIDSTAGERERRSLEALLINPVPRWRIMAGKLLATMLVAAVSLLMTTAAFGVTVTFIPQGSLGVRLNLDAATSVAAFLLVLPVIPLASSMQVIIAAFTRSFREAQTYISFLLLVPMVPVLLPTFMPVKFEAWMTAVPLYAQALLIEKLLRGEALAWEHWALSWTTTLACGFALSWIAAQLYRRESLLFSD